jgi:hypothetical protein
MVTVYPKKFNVFPPEEVVERARSRIGEQMFAFFTNDSSKFSRWCKLKLTKSTSWKDCTLLAWQCLFVTLNIHNVICSAELLHAWTFRLSVLQGLCFWVISNNTYIEEANKFFICSSSNITNILHCRFRFVYIFFYVRSIWFFLCNLATENKKIPLSLNFKIKRSFPYS